MKDLERLICLLSAVLSSTLNLIDVHDTGLNIIFCHRLQT